ncbi:MAG: HEPN domain-containing protein [Pseudomonadota bacterium]
MDRLSETLRWMLIAERDFHLALDNQDRYPEEAVYHFQQSAEKYLKAFLFFHEKPLKRTHDMAALVLACVAEDVEFLRLQKDVDPGDMTLFATRYRYPNEDGIDSVSAEDRENASLFAAQVRSLVRAKLAVVLVTHTP